MKKLNIQTDGWGLVVDELRAKRKTKINQECIPHINILQLSKHINITKYAYFVAEISKAM